MKHRSLWVTLCAVFLTALLTFQLTFSHLTASYERELTDVQMQYDTFFKDNGFSHFATIAGLFDRYSVYDLTNAGLDADTLIELYMQSVNDPYAEYFTEEEYAEFMAELNGDFVGVGIQVVFLAEEGVLQVLYTLPNSPADTAGLQADDRITAIGTSTVSELGYAGALAAIRGEAGTAITLTVARGDSSFQVTLQRAAILSQTVRAQMLTQDERVGYVRITSFEAVTPTQFSEAVQSLTDAGAEALIFDLRENGGGLLSAVCEMLAWLLPDGPIAFIEEGTGAHYSIRGEGDKLLYGSQASDYRDAAHSLSLPIAVLTNGNTASAAELFTAALRDYATDEFGNALPVTVVGTKTYGKGVMQSSYVLSDGSALKLTMAYYNPPSGVNYDKTGITPHITVGLEGAPSQNVFLLTEENDPQLIAARDHLTALLNK